MTSNTLQIAALVILVLIVSLLLGQGLKNELNRVVTTQKVVRGDQMND